MTNSSLTWNGIHPTELLIKYLNKMKIFLIKLILSGWFGAMFGFFLMPSLVHYYGSGIAWSVAVATLMLFNYYLATYNRGSVRAGHLT